MKYLNKPLENTTQPVQTKSNSVGFQLDDHRTTSGLQRKQAAALSNKEVPEIIQKKVNATGLPDQLKSGIENLSGHAMDDVKVHYNSSQPAQLNAHAYAQGNQIHLAPGQEKHLPHEAWHVVQQKQGRVKPTMQMKGKVNVNDDKGLENEADVMGAKALSMQSMQKMSNTLMFRQSSPLIQMKGERTAVASTRITTRSNGDAIRRGNRRASITDTGGRSAAKLEISYNAPHTAYNTGYRNKVDELRRYVKRKMVSSGRYTRIEANDLINNNDTFLQAKAVEEISVGNCGEFGMVVFAHLVQNTTGQWVYRSRMNGTNPGTGERYDHAFVLTSNQDIAVDPDVTDVAGFNLDEATIADAWDGYQVMTLRQFMNRGNAYRTVLNTTNVVIEQKKRAEGRDIFSPEIQGYITEWAVDFNQEFERAMRRPGSTYHTEAAANAANPQGFNTNGSNIAGVDDKRTFAQKYVNSTSAERLEIVATASNAELIGYLTPINPLSQSRLVNLLTNARFRNLFASASVSDINKKLLLNLLPDDRLVALFNGSVLGFQQSVIRHLDYAKARTLFDGVGDVEKKLLINMLTNEELIHFFKGSIEEYQKFIILHLNDDKIKILFDGANDVEKKLLVNMLIDNEVITLFNETNDHGKIAIITHLDYAKLRNLFYGVDDAGKKLLVNHLTDAEVIQFFNERNAEGKTAIIFQLAYPKLRNLFYGVDEAGKRLLVNHLSDEEVLSFYNERSSSGKLLIRRLLDRGRRNIIQ